MPETIQEYKCPCCNGSIAFDSTAQKMKCPYCGTEFEMETLKSLDEGLAEERAEKMDWDTSDGGEWNTDEDSGLHSYVCNSCGGEIVADDVTAATSCPFCDSPVVLTDRLSGSRRPDIVIPFKFDKEAAKKGLAEHLKGKKFLPKQFSATNHIDEVRGVYIPFWLFRADADADMRFRATRVRTWSDSNYDYTETSYFAVMRSGSMGFDDVPVNGTSKLAGDLMESIEPFDMSGSVDFQTAYLAGYLADKYDIDAESSVGRANERVKKCTENAFASTVQDYTTVIPEFSSVRLHNGKVRYALLPVWILNTTWNGQKYTFAMNGQTGKFVGNLPTDKAAFWRWFGALTAIIGSVILAVSFLLWLL